MTEIEPQWYLDKKVIIGVISVCITSLVAVFVQTIYITSYFTTKFDGYDARLVALEKFDDDQQSHEKRITILEGTIGFIRDDLVEIKGLLRRQIPGAKP